MATDLRLKILPSEEVSKMYEKCVKILSEKGIKVVNHPQALKMLHKAGAQVDFDNETVRFPKNTIEEALRTVPHELTLAGRNEQHDCVFPHPKGLFFTRTVTGNPKYLEPIPNKYRDATLADVAHWGQLSEVLDEINFICFLSPQDVPGATADIHSLKALFENTAKHIIVMPFSLESVPYLYEMGLAVAGSTEAFKKRPITSTLCTSLSPLLMKDMDMEIIVQACRYGVPIYANPCPIAGATAPVTLAGAALQAGVEILAILVMSQMIQPGTPVLGQPALNTLDMATGAFSYASIEATLAAAAGAQFVREALHIPAFTHGFRTDSYLNDGQAMIESCFRGFMIALSGSDSVIGLGGVAGKANNPVKLIIDNSITKMVKRVISGVNVDDDTLAWKEIMDTPPGGHYLEQPHTLRHCREAIQIGLFANQPREVWEAQGSKDLYTRAVEEYKELQKKLKPQPLADDVRKELERIVRKADKDLASL